MEHESFEDEETAELMNKHFVNIKVDREERPDIDGIYMQAVVAMTGQGGWPMSVFLTPDGRPFYGGTYFPPVRRFNMPAFQEILLTVARLWTEERQQLLESSQKVTRHLQSQPALSKGQEDITGEKLDQATVTLAQGYDWKLGGWGQAPKFPQPMAIEYLLRRGTRGDTMATDMATHALHAMAKGGMYDVVGSGFARYSVDDSWLVPHFEKMLYDNAQLASVYLHAHLITGEEAFKRVCTETLDFVLREMTHSQGGFFSSLDADSDGEEGKFYVWTPAEIQAAIDDAEDARLLLAAYGVTEAGNFEGKNILQRVLDDHQLANEFGIPTEEVPTKLAALHARLLEARSKRVRPGTDDKVLVFWNALMLTAVAEAGRYLKRDDYTQAAQNNAAFLIENLYKPGRLLRSWREGQAKYNAYLEDYAGLILGLLALYQTDADPHWYQFAIKLADEMVAHFSDPEGGFFDTRDDHETLLLRPKDMQDNATPSGNALAALALLLTSAYGDRLTFRDQAERMLRSVQSLMVRHPTAFAQWLCAADFALGPIHEVAIIGQAESHQSQALVDTLWEQYRPRMVAASSQTPISPLSPQLLAESPMQNDQATAYVCQNFICQQPVNSADKLRQQLEGS
jgi:uncharacterized protein YyaL (SSP411 family)